MEVKHDEKRRTFHGEIDGHACEVNYEMKDEKTMNLIRTFVAPELRGKGAAAELLEAFTAYAAEKGLKIIPSCSYAVVFFKKHKEYQGLLAPEADLENGGSCRIVPPGS